jgi:hypothetical protein
MTTGAFLAPVATSWRPQRLAGEVRAHCRGTQHSVRGRSERRPRPRPTHGERAPGACSARAPTKAFRTALMRAHITDENLLKSHSHGRGVVTMARARVSHAA